MVIRKVILESTPTTGDILSISKSVINFGATFIKTNKLEYQEAVSFLQMMKTHIGWVFNSTKK